MFKIRTKAVCWEKFELDKKKKPHQRVTCLCRIIMLPGAVSRRGKMADMRVVDGWICRDERQQFELDLIWKDTIKIKKKQGY